MEKINKKLSQEIIFRISFEGIDDTEELVITKDGAYNFVPVEKLKSNKNVYEEVKLEWSFCTLRVNQEYYAQFLEITKGWLNGKLELYGEKKIGISVTMRSCLTSSCIKK